MDIAQLGMSFDARPATTGAQELDKLTASAGRAEASTEKLTATQRAFGSATTAAFSEITTLLRAIQSSTGELAALARAQQTAATATAGHTRATEAQTTATNALASATERASTAGMQFYSSWKTVQTTMGGVTGAFSGASDSLQQFDSHILAHQQHLVGASRALGQQDDHVAAYRKRLADLPDVQNKATGSSKVLQQATLNLGRQFADIGVQLGSGQSPLLILIQQGPQIADAFTVASQAGLGFRAVMAGVYATIAPFIPVLLGIAAAAAAIAAPFAIAAQQINADNKGLIAGLGLTADQLENVKNKGVTMGDVLRGTWKTVSQELTAAFGPEIEAVKGFFADMYQGAVDGAVWAIRNIVGGFVGAVGAVKASWSLLPAAIGDAAITAANAVLGAVEGMINGGIRAINRLLPAVNALQVAMPGPDVLFSAFSEVSIGRLANRLEGSMGRLGDAAGTAYARDFARGVAAVDRIAATNTRNILSEAEARMRREAGDAGGGAAGSERMARAAREIETLWPKINRHLVETGAHVEKVVDPLVQAARELTLLDDLANDAGRGMADSFGRAGDALAGMVTTLSRYRAEMAAVNLAESENNLTQEQAARERTALEIRSYGDMASAAKGFFGERTAAYKALQGIEMAYRALQFANSVRAMALDTAETGSSIGNSLARGAAKAAEGVADIFAKLGPWGFPVAAAALAVMASVGVRVAGGGGSASAPTLPTTNTGTGTVLGNGQDQSASLGNSMELAERYWNKDLEFSNKQLASLKAIQSSIGSLTTAIAKEMQIGGGLDPSGLNQGPRTSGGFLGLFQNTTSSNVVGSGINLSGGQLADLIASGVSGALYQIVQTTRTNNGFFGLGGSTRTTNSEVSSGIDGGLSQEFSRVLASLRDGVLTAAGQLGVDGASAVLDAFQVNLGRISFEGMSSSEINDTLNAVFSAVGDDMARAILPGLDAFQRAGEGLLETLSRLATEYRVVDTTLASIGMTFGAVGLASIEARTRLVELTGGLDAFTEGASFFAENFLTEQQRIAPVQAAVTAELTRLGLATDITRTQFADLVMGLDVSTASGAEMFAALMRLAPALDQTLTYTEELTGAVTGVVDAIDLSRQRRSLEIALMEAQGDSVAALAARRADELAAMDASLRPLQEAVWAEMALTEARTAGAQVAATRRTMEVALMEAQGNAIGALAARRQDELAALDASLRPIQEAINAANDLAAARAAAAEAERAQVEADRARADQVVALGVQRRALEIEWMEASGFAVEALNARRQDEVAALDETLRTLQISLYAARDAQAAAAATAQIAGQQRALEITLMEAAGNAAGALAARRQDELAALDPSLRAIQQQIYAQTDLNAANERAAQAQAEAAQRVAEARSALSAAYEREASALRTTIDRFQGFSTALAEFRRNLGIDGLAGGASLAVSKADFERTSTLARMGNEEALSSLRGVSEAYLAQSKDYSRSSLDYLRDIALVRDAVQAAEDTAGRQASIAEQQLSALDASVAGLIDINESVLSVADAIGALRAAQYGVRPQSVVNTGSGIGSSSWTNGIPGVGAGAFVDPGLSANLGRNWGLPENAEINRTLAFATGYTGDFGSGGWQAWITQQDEQTRATARFLLEAAGQSERIVNFASGGIFRDGVVSQPTLFDIGRMGEAGEEAIMPLVKGPQGLGVRASGANDNSRLEAAIDRLTAENARMSAKLAEIASSTAKTERTLAAVTEGGRAMQTEVAA